MTANQNEIVFYILVRTDLELTPGKLAAQAGHAVQLTMQAARDHGGGTKEPSSAHQWLAEWEQNSYPKIVLAVNGEAALRKYVEAVCALGAPAALVIDEGRTQVAAGTATCAGVGPVPRSLVSPVLKRLQLLR